MKRAKIVWVGKFSKLSRRFGPEEQGERVPGGSSRARSNRGRARTIAGSREIGRPGETHHESDAGHEDVPAGPRPRAISLFLDSQPSGASVFEGARRLGVTPLVIELDNAELRTARRRLALRLSGYRPDEVLQGPSRHDVRVRVALVPFPATSAPPTAAAIAR